MKLSISLIVVTLLVVVLSTSTFILPEGRQAIITQFGAPVGDPIVEPGFHFKLPFIQKVRYIEKRIILWDGFPNQIPTRDKKFISVDTTARWKIIDPLKFIQTVRTERGARDKLDSILDGATRNAVSAHNLVEVVRNSNRAVKEPDKNDDRTKDELIEETTVLEQIKIGREKISLSIVIEANKRLNELGIEVIDLQLRRVSYEKSVESKVYDRMKSERFKIAEKIRAIGKAEKAKVEGRLAKELQIIQSEAYKKSRLIKGDAEAKAYRIYSTAFGKDPKFYEFIKTMTTYEESLGDDVEFILSSESEFLKFLKGN